MSSIAISLDPVSSCGLFGISRIILLQIWEAVIMGSGFLRDMPNPRWELIVALLLTYVLYLILYAKYFAPTANIPGSLLDKIWGIRYTINAILGRRMYFVDEQIRCFGPLVEIAPNKLACSDLTAIKTIYGSHEWRKSQFYSDFGDMNGIPSLFSELNPYRAQILRKAFLPAFSRANLLAMSKNVFSHLERFLIKLDEFDQAGKPVETYRWFRYLTFDVVTDIGFGVDYNMISSGEVDHPFVRDFDDAIGWGALTAYLGFIIHRIPKSWFSKSIQRWMEAQDRAEGHARQGLEKWQQQKSQGRIGHRVDILQRLIDHGDRYPDEKFSDMELITEIIEIMLAGGDTTATTLTYACYELTRYPNVQEKLGAALREAIPNPAAPIKLEDLESCQYLEWTIKEMLRTHPTLPSTLERVVPPKGAEIAGHRISGSTIVCMSAFIQHKLEDIFPQPDIFEPERWSNETPEMRQNLLAFSTGPRSCVGQNLAIMQMKIHMGMILRNFRVECHPETTPESMKAADFFQGKPMAGKCLLYFKRTGDCDKPMVN